MSAPVATGFIIVFLLIGCLAVEFGVLLHRVDRLTADAHGEPPAPHWTTRARAPWRVLLQRRRERREDSGLDEWLGQVHQADPTPAQAPPPGPEPRPEPEPEPQMQAAPAPEHQEPAPRPRPVAGPRTQPAHKLITPEAITGGGRHRVVDHRPPVTTDRQEAL